MLIRRGLALAVAAAGFASVAMAQDGIRTERVQFPAGQTGTIIEGTVTGGNIADYVLSAQAGQEMHVLFYPEGSSAYFNILVPNPAFEGQAIFVGRNELAANEAFVTLPETGDYTIRVYLLGAAADEDRTFGFQIEVSITGGGMGAAPPADNLQPTWIVAGVPDNDVLNVRGGPSVDFDIVGALGNGDVVGNLGCLDRDNSTWCRIRFLDEMGGDGWVNARYLVAGAGQGANIDHGGPAENLCATAVATEVGVNANNLVVTGTTISEATGYTVIYVGVPNAMADWICEIDRSGQLVSMFYGG